jgi:hypothetical protein
MADLIARLSRASAWLPGFVRLRRVYLGALIFGVAIAPFAWLVGWGVGAVLAVMAAAVVDRTVLYGRPFGIWSAACLVVWSLTVQAASSDLPLDSLFWREAMADWAAREPIEPWALVFVASVPVIWLGLAAFVAKGIARASRRLGATMIEAPIFLAAFAITFPSLAALGAPLSITTTIVITGGIIGLMFKKLATKLSGRVAHIDEQIEAIEGRPEGGPLRGINVVGLGQSARPKTFSFDDDEETVTPEVAAAVAPAHPVPMPAASAVAPIKPVPVEEADGLTPDPGIWDDEEGTGDGGSATDPTDLPADFEYVEDLDSDTNETATLTADNEQGETGAMDGDTDHGGDEESRRTAFMEARKLVEAYHLLVEQAATSDDLVSVRESIATLADMITNTTGLSLECLSEIEHPEVIDEWILSAINEEDADIERVIYDHFMSPSVDSDEFAVPALDGGDEPEFPQPTVTTTLEWEIAPSVVLTPPQAQESEETEPAVKAVEAEPAGIAVPVEVAAAVVEQPLVPTPFSDADMTEDEKSLLESILEDQDLLENGLRAIAGYDFKPKALNLLSGRVGALLRARWNEVLADIRLQRVFMTVLERVDDELFDKVGVRRAICSVRFTTALVPQETETFLLELDEKLKAGVENREDYEHLLGCRDRVESLTEAFGHAVDHLPDLAKRFRAELETSGRLYSEPLAAVVTELTGVQAIDANSVKRGMGHVLASNLDQHDRDLLDGFITVAKSVKALEQRVIMEAMRRQTDVSTHPMYDTVMSLKQDALARARALQDRVTISGGGETRLKNMLLSGGEDAAEVFGKILGSAQEVENYRIDGKSKNALLASLESQMAALKRLTSEHEVEKRELLKQSAANLTSDSVEAYIGLLAEVFSARKSAGNHNMVVDADTVLTRLKKGPAQALYYSKDTAFVFCFIYGQNRNDWYIKDASELICKSTSITVSLKQARAQVADLAEVQGKTVRMRFIVVHGNVESGMGMAFSGQQALEHPQQLLKPSELDRGLERLQANDDALPAEAVAANG